MLTVPITRSNARMPEMQQQHRYEDVRQPANRLQGMQVRTDADMFGAAAGRDLERAGYMMQRSANQFAHLIDDYNNTEARAAAIKMQEGFLSWQAEQGKKVGKDGMHSAADYDAWAKANRAEIEKGLSNDVQRGRFGHLADMQSARYRNWAVGYGEQQNVVYKTSLYTAAMSNAGNLIAANPNDPEMVAQAINQIDDASFSYAKLKGLDDKAGIAFMRENLDTHLGGAIHNLIQQGQTGTASNLMKQYGDQLGGMALGKLNAAMTRALEHQEAKARANEVERNFMLANAAAEELMGRVQGEEITHSEALLKIREIPNAKLRNQVRSSFSDLVHINKEITKEDEQAGRVKSSDDYERMGSDLGAKWAAVQDAKRAAMRPDATAEQKAYAKNLSTLYDTDRTFAESGIKSGSNPVAWKALSDGIALGEYTSEAALKGSEHWATIDPTGRDNLLATLKESQNVDLQEAKNLYKIEVENRNKREYMPRKDAGDERRFVDALTRRAKLTNRGNDRNFIRSFVDVWFIRGELANSGFFGSSGTYGQLNHRGKQGEEGKQDNFLPEIEDARREEILGMFNKHPEVKEAWKKFYGGNLNHAIRGYHLHQQLKSISTRGAQ